MGRKQIKEQDKGTEIIGIIGTQSGVGTTHTAYMLTAFLARVMGYKVALVEENVSGCVRQAGIILNNKFTRDISFYSQTDGDELYDVINRGYDFVIVDFGTEYAGNRSDFLMCTKKIVVGSLSWWNIHRYVGFVAKTEGEKSRKHWIFLATAPIKEGVAYMRKCGITIMPIPYEPDPFRLDENGLEWARGLTIG